MGKSFIITLLLIAGKVRPWKDYVCYTSVFEQGDMDILKPPWFRIPWPSQENLRNKPTLLITSQSLVS